MIEITIILLETILGLVIITTLLLTGMLLDKYVTKVEDHPIGQMLVGSILMLVTIVVILGSYKIGSILF